MTRQDIIDNLGIEQNLKPYEELIKALEESSYTDVWFWDDLKLGYVENVGFEKIDLLGYELGVKK